MLSHLLGSTFGIDTKNTLLAICDNFDVIVTWERFKKEQQKNLISNALILIGMSLIFVGLIKPVKPYGATTTTTTSNEENLILFFEILILAEKEKAKEKQRGRENR
uniref:Uncharacterized protein n=1 Tax=Glossina palpalis gambiensis TaxID=67801 RepID=A0A1B0B6Y3_9MUSC